MRTRPLLACVTINVLMAFLLQISVAYADTRIVEQLQSDIVTVPSGDHWGTKFVAPTTTTVQSIALGVSASCGDVILGHVETIFRPNELVADGQFTNITPIDDGVRFSGASVPIIAGNTYYILHGSSHFPCPAIETRGTTSSTTPQSAQIF